MRKAAAPFLVLGLGAFTAGLAVAQNAAPQAPASASNASRAQEGFFRPGDLPLSPPPATVTTPPVVAMAPPATTPTPAAPAPAASTVVTPPVVVVAPPPVAPPEPPAPRDIALQELEIARERARLAQIPPPIAGAFTGETSPESR